ncbi:amidohydrolase family protein [Amycolatopsis thermophila]|uniref:Imidazolonepropionase-like amidohydrolase n=1 Tax=Amycolatopsis thermophila TaxID=206084 RepID=A0ABU0EQ79_9PSEU|nr:amidohydrolase family protein [Amycolatopsis thermophila]MDQ0377450.1 imidazolonepropionase-like amidohydrolase [Amycolatopsis thermophila]
MLLAGGSVLDVVTGEVTRADVLVSGERIVEVGPSLDDPERVDCSGGLLVPGFIDCHVHVAFQRYGPRSARTLAAVPVLRALLHAGVTTVRDAWGADAGLRMAVARGWIDGPELLISLRQLSATGGIGDHWDATDGALERFDDPSMPSPVFDGPDAARAAVRRMVRAGTDWIKVAVSGSLKRGPRAHDVQVTDAELAALVDEAGRQGGRWVMAHAHGARSAESAAVAGVRSVEHGTFLDSAAVSAMAAGGTWYVPTLSVTRGSGVAEAHTSSVRLALEAGIPIAAGSDAVSGYDRVLDEVGLLAAAGLGPLDAVRAATSAGARLLGLDDRGSVAAGLRADLVLLDGTDLEVADLAGRVRAVWRGGRRVR